MQDASQNSSVDDISAPGSDADVVAHRWSAAAKAMARLAVTRNLVEMVEVLRSTARTAVGADGISVILRDGNLCHYYAEDAMDALWAGQRFPQDSCISGWAMLNRQSLAIPDIQLDLRVPQEAYKATFVKSMLMVPIGDGEPVAALGAYWAAAGHPEPHEMQILEALAQAASTALAHGRIVEEMAELNRDLEARVEQRTRDVQEAHHSLLQAQKLELIGQLTGNVAHDFNNLLSPIMTSLDVILNADTLAEHTQDHAQVAMEAVERARALVQRLLAFVRRQPVVPTAVDLRSLLKGMENLLVSTVGALNQVRILVPPALPSILADRQQLEIAILNLVVNARDAMAAGGVITISAAGDVSREGNHNVGGSCVRLTVSDQGNGMDEATRVMALEPFFTTKDPGSGTGLGLSMVHGVMQQIGGAIDIKSQVGVGTEIHLWLPVTHSQVVERPLPALDESVLEAKGTAIVVDDHLLVRRATAAMLRDEGYKVIEVESADACLAKLGAGICPEILITDHVMPGMNGLDLAQAVARSFPQVPVVLVSGYDGLEATPADVVRMTKPFRQHELQAGIARARRQAQSRAAFKSVRAGVASR